jgi:microcystin-dependent protein
MPTLQEQLQAAVTQTTTDSGLLHDIVHGDDTTTVTTENGPVKSVAKVINENQQLLTDSLDTLTTMRDEALASAAAAATSEDNASNSETNAAASESAAATSAGNADGSATAAANSAAAALVSETNAAASALAVSQSESNTAASETAAALSESNAATSEGNAAASALAASTSESNAAASESNAAASATDAAASAAAAAGSAAGQLFSDVIDLTVADSPFTVPAGANGNLYRVDTTGGDVEIILPELASLAADFRLGVAKASADVNVINVNRTGSDTINGLPSRTLSAQYNIDTFIGDKDNGVWYASGGGLGAVNVTVEQFSGDDTTTVFNLSGTPGSENNTYVFISGVYQQKTAYSLTGNQLTFSEAPPTGTDNIEVIFGAQAPIGVPSNDTVDTIHLKNGAVTLGKMAGGTPNKLLGYGAGGAAEEVDPPQAFLSGMVMPYAGAAAPSGWLLCDGSAISRTTYAALFAVVGTSFGTGDGSSTFNLPDMRGRVIAGVDTMGGTSANRLTSSYAHNVGGTGGSEQNTPNGSVSGSTGSTTLSTSQMPSHTHNYVKDTWFTGSNGLNGNTSQGQDTATSSAGGSGSHNHSLSASFTGNAMFVTQPWMTMNYIIKT